MDSQQSTARPARTPARVLVCLAVFNGMAWLEAQLESIRAQQGVEVSLVVSVDASQDGSEQFLDGYAAQHAWVRLLRHGERFGSASRNFFRLIRDADFSGVDAVAFADQDDIWLPEKLARAQASMGEMAIQGYSSNVLAFWPDGREQLVEKSQPQREWDFLFESAGPGCSFVLDRHLALAFQAHLVAHWDDAQPIGFHDWLIYAFARAQGHAWFIDPRPGLRYRQHAANVIGANSGWGAFRHRLGKVLDGWGLDQSGRIARVVGLGNHPFVRTWSSRTRAGYLRLAFAASQCRRRPLHRVGFFLVCLMLAVKG